MIRSALEVSGCAVALGLLVVTSAAAQDGIPAQSWPDTPVTRVEALALLETLNADLLSNDSATLTLDRWCEAHKMATPAKIVAERVHDNDKDPTDEVRKLLAVSPGDPVRYRHVRLHCGAHVLSEADNWYVPSRLTPEMNQALDSSDIAFGRAVQALQFRRRTSAELLWSPLPEGWEMGAPTRVKAGKPLEVPPYVIQHKAVLTLPDGTPISEVVETYTAEVLGFPEPVDPKQ